MARPEPGAVPGASQADGPVWGHWVSKDLVTFAQLDVALWNGAADGTDSFDDVGIYTGASAAHNYNAHLRKTLPRRPFRFVQTNLLQRLHLYLANI